ncbi:SIR2 family NAD-dependent protein deacylase [Desulfallas thermosapovorans]|uniref:protein acetyllysine N-acetyltransferase n=1 Tax=Desulfallas thermosapovorans DSM 6562 TaxID=1121431 RepID=A0A5S4ZQE9_9FIRM|nr:NAD-dependent deacylase [Desulfallas thermosapovorans]TYO94929.1 NAD-dependent deacetylase [Desulfallas thermosapovorans DSM 6562]
MSYNEKIKKVVRLIKESKKTLALTGAGISTESGIPDYRSPGTGLWEKHDPARTASLSALRKDPARFYNYNLDRWTAYSHAQPNAAHYALARLEKMGLLVGVITQNIDSLHVRAGATRVWEVHGHLRTCHCMECRESYGFDQLVYSIRNGTNPPRCVKCGGILRPDVVLFEDRMNEDFYQATQVISGCQLMLVVGSSLTVYPVAGLPGVAREIVIINRTPTPYDEEAAVVIHDSAGQVFRDIMVELGEPLP